MKTKQDRCNHWFQYAWKNWLPIPVRKCIYCGLTEKKNKNENWVAA